MEIPSHMQKNGLVYFIGSRSEGVVKIGMSSNETPENRMMSLQCGCPFALEVLLEISCYDVIPREVEKRLHKTFSDFSMRGEWFHMTCSMEYLMSSPQDGGKELVAVPSDLSRSTPSRSFRIVGADSHVNDILNGGKSGKMDSSREIALLRRMLEVEKQRNDDIQEAFLELSESFERFRETMNEVG